MNNYTHAANEGEKLTRQFIIDRMIDLDLDQQQLAEISGVSSSTISRWLSAKINITYNNLLKIYDALRLRPYLIPAEEDDKKMKRIFFN